MRGLMRNLTVVLPVFLSFKKLCAFFGTCVLCLGGSWSLIRVGGYELRCKYDIFEEYDRAGRIHADSSTVY